MKRDKKYLAALQKRGRIEQAHRIMKRAKAVRKLMDSLHVFPDETLKDIIDEGAELGLNGMISEYKQIIIMRKAERRAAKAEEYESGKDS